MSLETTRSASRLPRDLRAAGVVLAAVLALPTIAAAQADSPATRDVASTEPPADPAVGQPVGDQQPPSPTASAPATAPAGDVSKSEPKPAASAAASPDVRLTGRLEPLLNVRKRRLVVRGENGELLLATRTQSTGYLYVAAEAADLAAARGVRGLSLHLNGWVANEEAEVVLDRRRTADLTYGYLQYQDHGLDLRLGRQLVFTGGSMPVQIDGASARADLPGGFGVQAFGGLSVMPRFTDKPRYYLLGDRVDELVRADVREALDREETVRPRGSWSAGGRISHRFQTTTDVGVSFLEEREQSSLARRQLGFNAVVHPHPAADALASAVVDVDSWRPQELKIRADLYPVDEVQVSPGYSYADPALFLSRYSIFSVFANEANHDVGLDASYRPIRRVRVGGGYHHQFLVGSKGEVADYGGLGTRQGDAASFRADFVLGPRDQLLAGAEYRFFARPDNGFHSVRGYAAFQLTSRLSAAADASSYFYARQVPRFYESDGAGGRRSLDASLTLAYELRRWRFSASGGVTTNPLMQTAFMAVAKAEWQLEFGSHCQVGGCP